MFVDLKALRAEAPLPDFLKAAEGFLKGEVVIAPFPFHAEVMRSVVTFEHFLDLPRDILQELHFIHNDPSDPEDPDEGFLDRNKQGLREDGIPYDQKALNHTRPAILGKIALLERLRPENFPDAVWEFYKADVELHSCSEVSHFRFARALDVIHPGHDFFENFARPESRRSNVVRSLRYDTENPVDEEGTVAKLHDDRDDDTWGLYERHPGYKAFLPGEMESRLVHFTPGKAYVFAGLKLRTWVEDAVSVKHKVVKRRVLLERRTEERAVPGRRVEETKKRVSKIFFGHNAITVSQQRRFAELIEWSRQTSAELDPSIGATSM